MPGPGLFDLYRRQMGLDRPFGGLPTPAYGVQPMPGQGGGGGLDYGAPDLQIPAQPPPVQPEPEPPPAIPTEPPSDRFQRSYSEVLRYLKPDERVALQEYQTAHPTEDFAAGLPPFREPGKMAHFLYGKNAPPPREVQRGLEVYKERVLDAIAQQQADEQAAEFALKDRRMKLDEGNAPWQHLGETRQMLESPGFVAPDGGIPAGEAFGYAGLPVPTGAMAQGRISREIAAGKEQAARSKAEADAYLTRKESEIPIDKKAEEELGPVKAKNAGRESSARVAGEIDTKASRLDKIGAIATAQQEPVLQRQKDLETFKKGLKDTEPNDKNAASRILSLLPKDDVQGRYDRLTAIKDLVNAGSMPNLANNRDALGALWAEWDSARKQLARAEASRAPKAE